MHAYCCLVCSEGRAVATVDENAPSANAQFLLAAKDNRTAAFAREMLRLKHATLVSPAPQMDRLAGAKRRKDTNGGRTLVDLRSKVGGVSPNSKKRTPVGADRADRKKTKRGNQGVTRRAKTTRAAAVVATAAPAARLIQEQSTVGDPALGDSASFGLAPDVNQNNIIHGGDGANWSGGGLSWATICLALLGAAALILVAARVRERRSLQQQQQSHHGGSTPSKSSSSSASSPSSSSSSSLLFSADTSYAAGDSQPLLHGKGRDE